MIKFSRKTKAAIKKYGFEICQRVAKIVKSGKSDTEVYRESKSGSSLASELNKFLPFCIERKDGDFFSSLRSASCAITAGYEILRVTRTYRVAALELFSGEYHIEKTFQANSEAEALKHFMIENFETELLLLDYQGWNLHLFADSFRNVSKYISKESA